MVLFLFYVKYNVVIKTVNVNEIEMKWFVDIIIIKGKIKRAIFKI